MKVFHYVFFLVIFFHFRDHSEKGWMDDLNERWHPDLAKTLEVY